MAREKSISIYTDHEGSDSASDPWRYRWPNDADRNFNYTRLLRTRAAVARNTRPDARIAIIGAGAAGLTAARELFRCGFRRIDIYEASDRIGGRLWSLPADGQHATFELGAMRMPFFTEPGCGNSLLDHYCQLYGLTTQPFPNPGSAHARTGIYMNEGHGPAADMDRRPLMDIWEAEDAVPPHPILRSVHAKWAHFADLVQRHSRAAYDAGAETWEALWRAIAKRYWDLSFADLVFTPAAISYDRTMPGDFGGLGMSEDEAEIFYVIGAGDGGWGAFFHISALYPIRTLLFGYATNHQLIQGRFDPESGRFLGGPRHGSQIRDSIGHSLTSPGWLGVQSVAEGMLYCPSGTEAGAMSLYDAVVHPDYDVNLYTRTRVTAIEKVADGAVLTSDVSERRYDAVVSTCPTWALQLSMRIKGFDNDMLPISVKHSMAQAHWITSCKVFFPLKTRYWECSPIPQLMMTDSFIQGVYGYAVETEAHPDEPGLLLVSYTWEDDATKLLSFTSEDELARRCLEELDEICVRAENINLKISPFVDGSRPVVIHWSRQPTYAGCSKLYRARMWNENRALMAYNQEYAARSGLYFAGDAFSVTSGWVEPALRSAVDATIFIARNLGADFGDFDPERQYPALDTEWHPEEYAGSFGTADDVPPGHILCQQGEASRDMFLLLSGSLEIVIDGEVVTVIDEPDTFIGHMAFFARGIRTATVRCLTACQVVRIDAGRAELLLRKSPNHAIKLLRHLAEIHVHSTEAGSTETGRD